ncbi:conserved hypothetical protein, membrane [Candidatus Magnetobacterium bavaricum]|uniref:PQ loop repeat protein n=1 Tax=Candidatus Magnetobacterium bavaricum TaxID=29290 RepID=A0A0F3GX75_9BACT|nr:conserved hypothetical protein, membrane [Candidatus Magnetobacterium bavaricum]
MSIFEIIMLVCFGSAWPCSIYKSYKSGKNEGKSVQFLFIIFLGYLSGVTHKFLYCFDYVSYLYVLNGSMVFIDILLYFRNSAKNS